MPPRRKRDGSRPPAHREYSSTPPPPARQRTARQSRVVRCQPCAPLSTLARSAQRRCHRQQWHASDHQRSVRSSRAAASPRPAAAATASPATVRRAGSVWRAACNGAYHEGRALSAACSAPKCGTSHATRRVCPGGPKPLRGACGAVQCCASHVVPSALTSSAVCAIGRANNESNSARDSE